MDVKHTHGVVVCAWRPHHQSRDRRPIDHLGGTKTPFPVKQDVAFPSRTLVTIDGNRDLQIDFLKGGGKSLDRSRIECLTWVPRVRRDRLNWNPLKMSHWTGYVRCGGCLS